MTRHLLRVGRENISKRGSRSSFAIGSAAGTTLAIESDRDEGEPHCLGRDDLGSTVRGARRKGRNAFGEA